MNYDAERALELLRAGCGRSDAAFREGQEEAIRHVVEGRGRLLVVQRTGWGKSSVYFIATQLMRDQGAGPALLISPLLALMRNQLAAAVRMGVRAETINSTNTEEWDEIKEAVAADEVDILLIAPERLANENFVSQVLSRIAGNISLLVVDEAHCVSDWGHDFRPDYRRLGRIVQTLPENLRVLATTATANDRVMKDLQAVLGPSLTVSRGDLGRASLTLQTIRLPDQAARLAWLAERIPLLSGSGIVYTLTKRDARKVADWLSQNGIKAEAYWARAENRDALESALINNQIKVLVATMALGMGYDKPDLGFVVHFQTPGSVVAYYQQVGRAGRALPCAYGVLLSGSEDHEINDFFISNAFPSKDEVEAILTELENAPNALSIPDLLGKVNFRKGRVQNAIKLLSLESPAPIAKQGSRWQLTTASLSDEFWRRANRLTSLRRREQAEMQDYVKLDHGHMEFLVKSLDGDTSAIVPGSLPALPSVVDKQLVRAAVAFLRRTDLPIRPRKRWPSGGMPKLGETGNISKDRLAQEGRSLSLWGDAGWGGLVRQGMYQDGRLSEELVDACVQLVRRWGPTPAPEWVTCLPSTRHPTLVPGFAKRLAEKLGLPFVEVFQKVEDRPQQKTMENNSQQARNVDGAFSLSTSPKDTPVFLVDDLVNSGWTLTMAAWLLRDGGSGKVFPLTLATSGVH